MVEALEGPCLLVVMEVEVQETSLEAMGVHQNAPTGFLVPGEAEAPALGLVEDG